MMTRGLRRSILLGSCLAFAACGSGKGTLPTSAESQATPGAIAPTGTGSASSDIPMVSSLGVAPDGFEPRFRVEPRPNTDGIIEGVSPLAVEYDVCGSRGDAGKTLYFLYDWTFDNVPDQVGTGEDNCLQKHVYRAPSSEAADIATNICVVNGDPHQGHPSLYFSCRTYHVKLLAAPKGGSQGSPGTQIGNCGGTVANPGNGIEGCWYTAPALNMSCTDVCTSHGGFNSAASQHSGNAIGFLFWPGKTNGSNWMSVECSSTDNNTNWGATGAVPDAGFAHEACYVNCACNQ